MERAIPADPSEIAAAFHGFHHGDFIGVFEVGADGDAHADAGHAHAALRAAVSVTRSLGQDFSRVFTSSPTSAHAKVMQRGVGQTLFIPGPCEVLSALIWVNHRTTMPQLLRVLGE